MTGLYFVDTNVFVYARDLTEKDKQSTAADWLERLWKKKCGRVSIQVLNELYVTLRRKLHVQMPAKDARAEIVDLMSWNPVALSAGLIEAAWDIESHHSVSFWDALIVAAAHESGCQYLLSEDMQAGHDFDGIEVVNPFVSAPP